MELKDWVKRDMVRFVRRHEPTTRVNVPIRHEQATLLNTRDYETQIRLALKHNRFRHARQLFNELKQAFLGLPIDHQEERRQYYRLLQLAYKEIYEYVADKHKTSRILEEIQGSDNVFGTTKTGPRPASPRASVEEEMVRSSLQRLPVQSPVTPQPVEPTPSVASVQPSDPAQQESLGNAFSALSLIKQDLADQAPPSLSSPQAVEEPIIEPERAGAGEQEAPKPVAPTSPLQPSEQEISADSDEGLARAREQLQKWRSSFTASAATQSGARFVRKHPAAPDPVQHSAPRAQSVLAVDEGEVFSSLYVRGVQAMSQGNYEEAAKLFLRRVQQNPADRAARIRLTECFEVLDGTTT